MKTSTKYFLKIVLISLVIFLIVTPLRGGYIIRSIGGVGGIHLSSIVGFIIYFFLTSWFLRNSKERLSDFHIVLGVALGASLLTIPIYIIDFSSTLGSLLELLIHLSSVLLGYLCYKVNNKYYRIPIAILSFAFCFWISTVGYSLWLHKLSFKSFSGKTNIQVDKNDFLVQTKTGDSISISDFKGKYLVVDCWYTRCGVCYKEMPKVQDLYEDYKDNPDVQVVALHFRLEGEMYLTGTEIMDNRGFSIPCLSIDIDDPIREKVELKVFPTVFIFDNKGSIIFEGDIDTAKKHLKEVLKK